MTRLDALRAAIPWMHHSPQTETEEEVVRTTMIYTHIINRGLLAGIRRLDR